MSPSSVILAGCCRVLLSLAVVGAEHLSSNSSESTGMVGAGQGVIQCILGILHRDKSYRRGHLVRIYFDMDRGHCWRDCCQGRIVSSVLACTFPPRKVCHSGIGLGHSSRRPRKDRLRRTVVWECKLECKYPSMKLCKEVSMLS